MSRRLHIIILTGIGILIILVIINMPFASKAMTNILPGLLVTKETFDPYKDQIKAYQDELRRTDLPSEARSLLEEKLNTILVMATQRTEGKTNQPTRQDSILATPTIEDASVKLPDGIDNHPSVPLSESAVTVLNSWRKTTDDRYYLVYAGYLTQDTQQGAILVLHPDIHNFRQYNTPSNSGGVKVIEENGTTILLQSDRGTLFYFNVAIEQFVNSNGTPIPTNTPMPPTPTPIINFTPTPISPYP